MVKQTMTNRFTCDVCEQPVPDNPKRIVWAFYPKRHDSSFKGSNISSNTTAVGMYCSVNCSMLDTKENQMKRLSYSQDMREQFMSIFRDIVSNVSQLGAADNFLAKPKSPFRELPDFEDEDEDGEYNWLKYYGSENDPKVKKMRGRKGA